MKLQFLTEQNGADPYEVVQLLDKHCQPFLKQWTNDTKSLIRRENKVIDFFERGIRQDRRPLESSAQFHDAYNEFFKEKFGIDKLRSRCLFVHATSSPTFRGDYHFGQQAYYIFPQAETTYVASRGIIGDMLSEIEDSIAGIEMQMERIDPKYKNMDRAELVKEYLRTQGQYFLTHNLEDLPHSDRDKFVEVMMLSSVNKYYAIECGSDLMDKISKHYRG